MIREGSGEPLLLLHGMLAGACVWRGVIPLLAGAHDAIAPAALGHRGGSLATERPVRIAHLVDDAERLLDELGVESAHVAGNSMGGWVALELARRGRARSVTAFSPSGAWDPRVGRPARSRRRIGGSARFARASRRVLPIVASSAALRRFALRQASLHGDRVGRDQLVELVGDVLACDVADDLLSTDEWLAPIDPVPCPITIAWATADRVLPLGEFGTRTRARIPGARFVVLEDVGHVPMLDDPARVASLILETTRVGTGA